MGDVASFIASAYGYIGSFLVVLGGVYLARSFVTDDVGWSSAKKRGVIIAVMGAALMQMKTLVNGGLLAAFITFASANAGGWDFLTPYLANIGLLVFGYGYAQVVLNIVNEDIGSRVWGIRLVVGAAMIMQLGNVLAFIFD